MLCLGSKASRTPSPIKTSKLSCKEITANPEIPSQGAWRLALPCARSSPREGEPGGNPKPRKSSAVKVVMEPERIKGMNVIVATTAFGKICRLIILR